MATFSFTIAYNSRRHWIHGKVIKDESSRFVASSPELFPEYQAIGEYMNLAVGAFREGLVAWLTEHPEQVPKREAIHDG